MNILFVGGGSGGHFFPCMALIEYFKKMNHKCFYIGGKNKYEDKKKKYITCEKIFIELEGFKNNLKSAFLLLKSYTKNKKTISHFLIKNKINKVILFGNYESLIVGLIAKKLKIPYYIHEQNAVLGRSNYFLQKNAVKIFTNFNQTELIKDKDKIIRVGNPRMYKKYHIQKNKKILVIMGSLGAAKMYDILTNTFSDKQYNVTYVLGENTNKKNDNNNVIKFFDHSVDSFDNYDFIITRGGGTTLAEIAGYAIPCLIIPSPNVINNHQEKNAIRFVEEAGGTYLKEKEINNKILIEIIDSYLSNKDKYIETQIKMYNFALDNSCERMYKSII